jgi:hypothetical protein
LGAPGNIGTHADALFKQFIRQVKGFFRFCFPQATFHGHDDFLVAKPIWLTCEKIPSGKSQIKNKLTGSRLGLAGRREPRSGSTAE